MSYREVSNLLSSSRDSAEAYVLVREVRVLLDVGADPFHPEIRIKIWHSNAMAAHPYHFSVSHHVHTPLQAGPYYPSRTSSESEEGAIHAALDSTTSFLRAAINAGHRPSTAWLVRDNDF